MLIITLCNSMTSARVWSHLFGRFLGIFIQILVESETLQTLSQCVTKAFLSSSNLGLQTTKLHNQNEQENQLGGLAKRRLKITDETKIQDWQLDASQTSEWKFVGKLWPAKSTSLYNLNVHTLYMARKENSIFDPFIFIIYFFYDS